LLFVGAGCPVVPECQHAFGREPAGLQVATAGPGELQVTHIGRVIVCPGSLVDDRGRDLGVLGRRHHAVALVARAHSFREEVDHQFVPLRFAPIQHAEVVVGVERRPRERRYRGPGRFNRGRHEATVPDRQGHRRALAADLASPGRGRSPPFVPVGPTGGVRRGAIVRGPLSRGTRLIRSVSRPWCGPT